MVVTMYCSIYYVRQLIAYHIYLLYLFKDDPETPKGNCKISTHSTCISTTPTMQCLPTPEYCIYILI